MTKEKVLIVDDDEDVLNLCQRILESQGYDVTISGSGFQAIEIARNKDFDLLLVDIKLPDMNGLDIAQMLKEADPGLICVTMTGFSTMDTAINAVKLGIDEFILKPFTPGELNMAVSKALEKERLRKENVRLRSLIPLFELNKTLMGTMEEDKLLDRLIEIAQKETKAYFAGLYLMEDGQITTYFHRTDGQDYTEAQQVASKKLAESTFEHGQLSTFDLNAVGEDYQALIKQLDAVSVIAAPLKSKNANVGVLILAHKEDYFAPSDSEFLSILCGQAGIALENARLFTEIQEAYQQLQTLDHIKSEFINIAAHELRTPLAILMGYASVLEEEADNRYREFMSNIMRNAMRLRSLIDDMLNLQYLESGVAILHRDKLNLSEAVQEIAQDISLLAEEKQLEITIDIPEDFPKMIVDRHKFDLILVNLTHNAVKFIPAGGRITFWAEVTGDKATISVHNTGTTIPKEKIDRVFDRFYQIENSLTREYGGAGLGLAIARGMAEVCGGEISVESSEEEGTTFTLTLPLDNTHLEARKLKL
jgi:signal transduction histidine kinase/ActR/RegA family two-component response regulator